MISLLMYEKQHLLPSPAIILRSLKICRGFIVFIAKMNFYIFLPFVIFPLHIYFSSYSFLLSHFYVGAKRKIANKQQTAKQSDV